VLSLMRPGPWQASPHGCAWRAARARPGPGKGGWPHATRNKAVRGAFDARGPQAKAEAFAPMGAATLPRHAPPYE
jgi:hypothetical protein